MICQKRYLFWKFRFLSKDDGWWGGGIEQADASVNFLPRENQNLAREKTQNIAREKTCKKCPWTYKIACYLISCWKSAREKTKLPVKPEKNKFFARENDFLPVKKAKKTQKVAREKS